MTIDDGSSLVSFSIQTGPVCRDRRLRPIVAKYQAGNQTASPRSELVWWNPWPQLIRFAHPDHVT